MKRRPSKPDLRTYFMGSFVGAAHAHFGRCQWCGERISRASATADHVRAVGQGGTDELSNLALSCGPCNGRKADSDWGRPRFGPADWSAVLSESALYGSQREEFVREVSRPSRKGKGRPDGRHAVLRDGKLVYVGEPGMCRHQAAALRDMLKKGGVEAVVEVLTYAEALDAASERVKSYTITGWGV